MCCPLSTIFTQMCMSEHFHPFIYCQLFSSNHSVHPDAAKRSETPVLSFRNSVAVVTTQVACFVSRRSSVKVKVWWLPSLSPWPRTIPPPALVLSSHQCFSSVGRGQPALSHSRITNLRSPAVLKLHRLTCTYDPSKISGFIPSLCKGFALFNGGGGHKYCSYSTLSAGCSVQCLQSFTFNQKKASPCATGSTCSD